MSGTKLYLKKANLTREGKCAVIASTFHNNKRMRLGTGVSVKPEDWNDAKQEVRRTDPNYAHLNAVLSKRVAEIDRELVSRVATEEKGVDILQVQSDLSRRQSLEITAPPESFWDVFERFLALREHAIADRTHRKYKTVKALLKEYQKKHGYITFDSITHDFGDAFKKFLTVKKEHTNNTVGKYVSALKTFLAWAEERGAQVPPAYRKFKVDEDEVEVLALTWDELQMLSNVDLKDQLRLDRVRDLFLFACYTGARFGDIQAMAEADVQNGIWNLRAEKTKSIIQIPLIKEATAILKKYTDEKQWLPQISSQRMNDYLKELGKQIGLDAPVRKTRYYGSKAEVDRRQKWEFLSSHFARRTFVTLSLQRGMRPEVVMSITGHRSFKTMKRYIDLDDKNRKEEMERVWG